MTWAILYPENADIVATFSTREEAVERLNAFVELHPEISDEIAVLCIDEHGHGVGKYIYAEQHAAQLPELLA
jgi:hypothetical protein